MSTIPSILSIQDISAVGRCAMTTMIPIASALGCQVIPLPTAILSNHLHYPHYKMVDFSNYIPEFLQAWENNGLSFSAIVSGFLANTEQIHLVDLAIKKFMTSNQYIIVDPAMGDHGKLYSIFTPDMQEAMRRLVTKARVITPNYTEACFLLDEPYEPEKLTITKAKQLCQKLSKLGPSHPIITGMTINDINQTVLYDKQADSFTIAGNPSVPIEPHGAGDIFTATLAGLLLQRFVPAQAVRLATNFTSEVIASTYVAQGRIDNEGIVFEPHLHRLTSHYQLQSQRLAKKQA